MSQKQTMDFFLKPQIVWNFTYLLFKSQTKKSMTAKKTLGKKLTTVDISIQNPNTGDDVL